MVLVVVVVVVVVVVGKALGVCRFWFIATRERRKSGGNDGKLKFEGVRYKSDGLFCHGRFGL